MSDDPANGTPADVREDACAEEGKLSSSRGCLCFLPLLGVVTGFGLGLVLTLLTPSEQWTSVANSFFMLLFGVLGWAAGMVFQGVQLHCGGTRRLDRASRGRYAKWGVPVLALAFVAVFLLAKGYLVLYFLVVFLIATMFAGEIGWGDPLALVYVSRAYRGRDLGEGEGESEH